MSQGGSRRLVGPIAAVVLVACQFPRPPDVDDADAGPRCEPDVETCVMGAFSACGPDGRYVAYDLPNGGPNGSSTTLTMHDYPCPLGCDANQSRCLDVLPTNGLAAALDGPAVSPNGMDVDLADASGDALMSTDAFDSMQGTVLITEGGGRQLVVPALLLPQTNAPDIVALMVRTFTIRPGVRLRVIGQPALAVASHFDVYVAGDLDLSGPTRGAGLSLDANCNVAMTAPAAGGGGNATAGSAASTGSPGGTPLLSVSPNLVPLEGGCSNSLGVGGGAVQLVSRTTISLASTGTINVSGRHGQGVIIGSLYATGGGSGGGVVLEAPTVSLTPGGRIAGRGGSGAAANTTTMTFDVGRDGDWDLNTPDVPGGTCSGCGIGGDGGTESRTPTNGTGAGDAVGGGGGAVGRCVIRNRSGGLFPPSGTMKIAQQALQLGTR